MSLAHPPPADTDEVLKSELAAMFKGPYTVRVGDICYALIGQIVNRSLLPVQYIPSGILEVDSPVQMPALATAVKQDWSGLSSAGLMTSLLADARASDQAQLYGAALRRLRFYYPGEYQRHRAGELQTKIAAFEAGERK